MNSLTQGTFDLAAVGKVGDPVEFFVDRERLQAYAGAISSGTHLEGQGANPLFHVIPATKATGAALSKVVINAGQGLLGELDIKVYAPPQPGTFVTSTASIVGVSARSSGVVVTAHASSEVEGKKVSEQWITIFYRGISASEVAGAPHEIPELLVETPDFSATTGFQPDQTYRYGGVSGDLTAVHVDSRAAVEVGLPGLILHGACTLAMVTDSVVAAAGARTDDVTRVAARLAGWVQPSDTLTTDVTRGPEGALGFETRRQDGVFALKRGFIGFD